MAELTLRDVATFLAADDKLPGLVDGAFKGVPALLLVYLDTDGTYHVGDFLEISNLFGGGTTWLGFDNVMYIGNKARSLTAVTINNPGSTIFDYDIEGLGNISILGNADFGNATGDTFSVAGTATFSHNTTFGTSSSKTATFNAKATFGNASGARFWDTDVSHRTGLAFGSNLTADRTFTLTTGDANTGLDISAVAGTVTISAGGAAMAALAWSSGTQIPALTAAGTAGLKTVGASSGNILDKAAGDSLYQPLDGDLTTIAGLAATTDNFIVSVASAWASRTPAQVRTTLSLGTAALVNTGNAGTTIPLCDGTNTWANLQTFASGISVSSGNVLLPSGTTVYSASGDVFMRAASNLRLGANGTNDLAILSSTGLALAGLLDLSASGAGQIKFPATQNASANANTLDDYEEGTFTPVLKFGGATTGITYGVQSGVYTKVGNAVTIALQISLSSKGSATGSATITGLPFTNAALQKALANILATFTLTGSFQTVVSASGTTIDMSQQASGTWSQVTDAQFNNASVLVITGTYMI